MVNIYYFVSQGDMEIPKILSLPQCEINIPNYVLKILIEDKHLLDEERLVSKIFARFSYIKGQVLKPLNLFC